MASSALVESGSPHWVGEMEVESVKEDPRWGCSCPSPRLAHLPLFGQAKKGWTLLVYLPPATLHIKEGLSSGHHSRLPSWTRDLLRRNQMGQF